MNIGKRDWFWLGSKEREEWKIKLKENSEGLKDE